MMETHFADGGFVMVKNRTTAPLSVTYNGRSVTIPPYGKGGRWMAPAAAQKAIEQNRLMGTEDPLNYHDFESLVYVEGSDMPSDQIEQSEKIEAIDRSLLPPDAQNVTVVTVRRPMSGRDQEPTLGAHFTGASEGQ